MVFALVGGSLLACAETGFPLSRDPSVIHEEWYTTLDAGSFRERWRYLWSPLTRRNGIEAMWRYRYSNDQAKFISDYMLRSRYRYEKWEIGFGAESEDRIDSDDIAGYLSIHEEPYRIWLGDLRPGLPDGLLLSDRTRIVWATREHSPITGSIDPDGDVFGGTVQSQYKLLRFAIGGGEERRKTKPSRLYWSMLGWNDETRWQFDLSGLSQTADSSSRTREYHGFAFHTRWHTETEAAEVSTALNRDGGAYAVSALTRGFGTIRAEWYGRQGEPPVDRGETRFRLIRQGVWLEQRLERNWEYRTAVEFTQSLVNEKEGRFFFSVVTPVIENGRWSGYISARSRNSLGSIAFHRMGIADSWGTGGKIAYNTRLLETGWSGLAGGYVVHRISHRYSMTLWLAGIHRDTEISTQSFSPILPQVTLSGLPALTYEGGYAGGAAQWRFNRWLIQCEAWGLVFRNGRNEETIHELRLQAGFDLE